MIGCTLPASALVRVISLLRIQGARKVRPLFTCLALLCCFSPELHAAAPDRVAPDANMARMQTLPNQHPLWASQANGIAPVPSGESINQLTLVLARSAQQQAAFETFLADQQNPASPEYHHWLTPSEVGERFGVSDTDVAAVTAWLQSQGLTVNWIAPSRLFIGFGGAAASVNRAFHTELRTYRVNGVARMSISSDPQIPQALAPVIKAIRGLYSIDEQPQHIAAPAQLASPEITFSSGHFIGPGDFNVIYDVPSPTYNGSGVTIGIVGEARTDAADFDNFKARVGSTFSDPTEVVPTAFGGVDPGPAFTAPTSLSLEDQAEATLDVMRTGSVAPAAKLLLVVATAASGGIGTDAQYLVNTTPLPAQIMSISFGACESAAGSAGVSYWDSLFQQAAAEGISVFVSSGDSGAAGCDTAFAAPPASAIANSPNYICSSSYATCVGGTEFNDTTNPATYWGSVSGPSTSALGYIPEGAWNESWNGTVSSIAATGGGVSGYVATPSWQNGVTGVPAANAGRYTPDISFSASAHDGYFGCMAAASAPCTITNGSFYFTAFSGTSAAAPGMAGITALLDQNMGSAQGNLNPGLYQMLSGAPDAFNDVTLASSGVGSCDLNTPSMCNNSIGGPTGLTGSQPGYAIGTGYDEATGLGSLDAAKFVNDYGTASTIMTPTVVPEFSSSVSTNEPLTILVYVRGSDSSPVPTGTVVATIGTYTSATVTLSSDGSNAITMPAGALPVGSYTVQIAYTPDSASAVRYTSATGSGSLSVIVPPKVTPTMGMTASPLTITNSETMTVGVTVNTTLYYPTPAGTVTLSSGSYSAGPVTLAAGSASFTIPAGSLAVGEDTVTATYTPDSAASSSYLATSNFLVIENEGATITPVVYLGIIPSQPTTAQTLTASVSVDGFTGHPIPTGTVKIASGPYSSASASLAAGQATFTIPAGSLAIGLDTVTATYTPDASSSATYGSASGGAQVGVSLAQMIAPAMTITSLTSVPITTQPLSLAITLATASGYPAPSGIVSVGTAGFGLVNVTLVNGAVTATIPPGSFMGGTNAFTAQYSPDANASYIYTQQTASISVNVAKATPAITVVAQPASAATTDSVNVTVTVSGGVGAPMPTGLVTLSSGAWSSQSSFPLGAVTFNVPAGVLAAGTDAFTAAYQGDNDYNAANGTGSVNITAPAGATFSISGTNVTFPSTGTGGGSNITVTPTIGFVGAVQLTAAFTSQPAGAKILPTLSFGSTSPVNIQDFATRNALLTVTANPSATGSLHLPAWPGGRWFAATGATLGCMLFLWIPRRRRHLRNIFGALALLIALSTGMLACGGGGSSGGNGGGTANPGTTPGNYVITVTGTSGTITATCTVNMAVAQ